MKHPDNCYLRALSTTRYSLQMQTCILYVESNTAICGSIDPARIINVYPRFPGGMDGTPTRVIFMAGITINTGICIPAVQTEFYQYLWSLLPLPVHDILQQI